MLKIIENQALEILVQVLQNEGTKNQWALPKIVPEACSSVCPSADKLHYLQGSESLTVTSISSSYSGAYRDS